MASAQSYISLQVWVKTRVKDQGDNGDTEWLNAVESSLSYFTVSKSAIVLPYVVSLVIHKSVITTNRYISF